MKKRFSRRAAALALTIAVLLCAGGVAAYGADDDPQAALDAALGELQDLVNGLGGSDTALATIAPIGTIGPIATFAPIPTIAPIDPIEPITPAEPLDDKEALFGTVEGGEYINEHFGLRCELGEGWSFLSDDDIRQMQEMTLGLLGDTDIGEDIVDFYAEALENGAQVVTVAAENGSGSRSFLAMLSSLPQSLISDELWRQSVEESQSMTKQLMEQAGNWDVDIRLGEIDFAGKARMSSYMSYMTEMAGPERQVYSQDVYLREGDYMLKFTMTSTDGEDFFQEIVGFFSPLDGTQQPQSELSAEEAPAAVPAPAVEDGDDVYINEDLGFLYRPADGWTIQTAEEIAEQYGDDEEGQTVAMAASGKFGLNQIQIISTDLEDLGFPQSMTEETIAAFFTLMMQEGAKEDDRVESAEFQRNQVEFAGETRWGYRAHITLAGSVLESHTQAVFLCNGEKMVYILMQSFLDEGDIDGMLEQFSAYDGY